MTTQTNDNHLMRALHLSRPDNEQPPLLSLTTLPIPHLQPDNDNNNNVLVKIHAASINPSDILNARGGFPYTSFPRIPGRDYSGTIISSSNPTTTSSSSLLNTAIFGTSGNSLSFTQDGVHAEYCIVPFSSVAPKPENLTFTQAATIGVPFTTASLALRRSLTQKTDIVLVFGATGSVGAAATQLARVMGCTVITASRRAGVSDIILVDGEAISSSLRDQVSSLTADKGANVIIDTTGDPSLVKAALNEGVLAQGGRLVLIAAPKQGSTELVFDMKALYRKEQSIVGCNSLSYSADEMGAELREMAPLFQSGRLRAVDEDELVKVGLDAALDVYKAPKSQGSRKVVIEMVK